MSGNNLDEVNKVKQFLSTKFMIKDLGKLKYFLGIEVLESESGMCLSQRKYCLELLSDFGLLGSKPVTTPLETNLVIHSIENRDEHDKPMSNISEYQRLVGKLIYLTLTRPYISYTIQCLSQYMHAPLESHLKIVMRLLRYLKLSLGKGILFSRGNSFELKSFVDADWGKCITTRKSVTGFCVYLGNNLVSWKSKKQPTVSRSSTEAEYRDVGVVTCELMWIIKILFDFGITGFTPAILIASNPVYHESVS